MYRSDLKFLVLLFVACFAVITAVVAPTLKLRRSEVVQLLPESATEIQEHFESQIYAVKAKVSHEEFEKVAIKLGLTESEMEYDIQQSSDWWELERSRCKTLYRLEGGPSSRKVIAGWQEGYLYFLDSHPF